MKKMRTAIVLAVVLLALGGLATWDEWESKREKAEKETATKLVSFKPESVQKISFSSRGVGEKPAPVEVDLVKLDGAWRIVRPIEARADATAVEALLKSLHDYDYAKVVAESRERWAEFGLQDAAHTIALTYGEGKDDIVTLLFGNKAPVGYSAYVRTTNSDKVYIGSQHILMAVSKSLFDFRDKTVATVEERAIKAFVYRRDEHPTIEMSRVDGKWRIEKPMVLEADDAEVKDLIEEIAQVKAAGFVDVPSKPLVDGLNKPAVEMMWTNDKGEVTTLKVAGHEGKFYAAFDPSKLAIELPDEFYAKIEKDLTALRNRRVLHMDSLDLSQVDVDGDSYKNVGGSWFKAADAEKADKKEVNHLRALVVDLEFARTDRFLALDSKEAKTLTEAPLHRITLTFKDPVKQPNVVLELFPAPGADDKFLVRRSGAENVYRVPKSSFNGMTPAKAGDKTPSGEPSLMMEQGGDEPPLDEPLDESVEELKDNNG